MRTALTRLSVALIVLASVAAVRPIQAQKPGENPFAGRWEIEMFPPASASGPAARPMRFAIIEIAGPAAGPTGKLIDMVGAPLLAAKIDSVSSVNDELKVQMTMASRKMTFTGKRSGADIKGTITAEGEAEVVTFIGRITASEKLPPPEPVVQSAETKAFNAAMIKRPAERIEALKQFLKDFPDSRQKEQAHYQIALSAPDAAARIAALRAFLAEFPNSPMKDSARLQIALAPTNPAEKTAALRAFIDESPSSPLRDQAEYQIVNAVMDPAARLAAQEEFVKTHPKSQYASTLHRAIFDTYVKEKPVNEAKLTATIDAFVASSPDMTMPMGQYQISARAGTLNTIADRLMVNDVLLDKALDLIQQAVTLAGDKEDPTSRSMYITTLGQVLYKQKKYDQAERELKRATAIGNSGSGEADLYLGKLYEDKKDDQAALDAYLRAAMISSSREIKTSLERAYTRKNGSLAGLEDKLDAAYRARPKAFEPGHFTRPAANAGEPARVVLAELFTGAECVPCIASDLAFDGLSERYDEKTLAVLVYHLHIPGPDPMTNADTETRAKYYEVSGTPTAVVDGLAPKVGGGPATQADRVFTGYKDSIESRLARRPQATLTGFTATVSGSTINVKGQAEVAAAGAEAIDATLRVVLVQDMVRYTGANGIRFHNLVVRKLLGPAAGTSIQKAGTRTEFTESVDVKSLEGALGTYLDGYEKTRSRPNAAFTFTDRVTTLDPKQLRIVAFVQDNKTKEVLQAIIVTPGR